MKITGTIELKDGTEISFPDKALKSKKSAERYAKRIKKRGFWAVFEGAMFGPEAFVFPAEILSINLECEPITIPERPDKPNRTMRKTELPAPQPGETNPYLTDDGQLKPGMINPNAAKTITS